MRTSNTGMSLAFACTFVLLLSGLLVYLPRVSMVSENAAGHLAWDKSAKSNRTHDVAVDSNSKAASIQSAWPFDKKSEDKFRVFYAKTRDAKGDGFRPGQNWVIAYFETPDSMPVLYNMYAQRLGNADIRTDVSPIFALTVNGARKLAGPRYQVTLNCDLQIIINADNALC